MLGIDISNWQSISAANTDGADFVVIKATQGTGYVSPTCDQQYQLAKSVGKKVGVYHYASGGDPIAEADFFINNTQGYLNEALIALDWESAQNPRFGEHASWCLAFLARFYQRTGIKPVIYMSASVLRAADWSALPRNDYGLWIAGYPDNRNSWDVPDFIYSASPWDFYALWQYTSSGGVLDRDVFSGDRAAWDAYARAIAQAPQNPNINRDQLNQLYRDLLGRDPDQGGIDHYVGNYTYDFVKNDILNSAEYAQRQAAINQPQPTPEPTPTPVPVPDPVPEQPSKPDENQPSEPTDNKEEPTMPDTTTTPTTPAEQEHTPATNGDAKPNYRALSNEEFAALTQAGAFEVSDGWKPTIPDKYRLVAYLASGIGTPLVTVVFQLLAVFGVIDASLAVQVIATVAAFFGTVAGLFGVSHFTRSK